MQRHASEPGLSLDEAQELVDDWLVHLRGMGKSEGTLVAYRRGVTQYLMFCAERGHDEPIRRRVLSAWLAYLRDEKQIQGYTARARLTAVRQYVKWLLDEGEVEFNPFTDMSQPAVDEKLVEPLTPGQIKAMLKACEAPKGATPERVYVDTRDMALVHVLAETGMRAGEVLALEVDDVHSRETSPFLVVQRSKNRRGRTVPISAQCAERLNRYARARRRRGHADSREFWLAARGGPLQYAGLYDALTKRADAAGIAGWHPHRMRHTAAHRWLAAGGSEGGLMSVAGWQSPQMLMRYTRAQAAARAAEEAKRLNLGEL